MVYALVSLWHIIIMQCRAGRQAVTQAGSQALFRRHCLQNGCSQPDPFVVFSRSKVGLTNSDEIHFVVRGREQRETEIDRSLPLSLSFQG